MKRQHEGLAVGYVGARIIEGSIIILGGISSLLLLTLSRAFLDGGSAETAAFEPSGALLLEAREWTDALGTAIVFGISALILYGLMYRSELVPRWLSAWGFIGAVLVVAAGIRGLYGHSPSSTLSVILTLPIRCAGNGPCRVADRQGIHNPNDVHETHQSSRHQRLTKGVM